jgi:cell fate regulator YaaT (PSP1 superfamily)
MPEQYLVRYGLMSHVGRFVGESGAFARGQTVVVQSARGVELGEVLLQLSQEQADSVFTSSSARVLRSAEAADFDRARHLEGERTARLLACERVFRDGLWPLELVDVEPMLDGSRTVLHYLGPHKLDTAGLAHAMRERCGLEVWLEPVGRDAPDDDSQQNGATDACAHCGAEGGGCGSAGGCATGAGTHAGGCSGCAVKELMRTANR